MKFNARSALVLMLLVPVACKGKDAAPQAAPSASPGSAALATSAAGAGSLALLDGFEGEIALSAKGKLASSAATGPTNFTMLVKDGKFRVAVPESLTATRGLGTAYLLVTPAEKKLYAVLDAKKQAVLIDLDKLSAQAKALSQSRAQPKPGAAPAAELQKTGKTETVAGYKCEVWHVVQAKSVADVCVAEQGTSWFHLPLSGAPAEYAWASELADGKHFPLRFVSSDNGVEQGRIEVTSIQKKALAASDFEVPAGYAVLSLDQMLGGLLGGLGGNVPSGMPSGIPGLPPGFKLPPGIKLPPGVTLPNGVRTN